jgi:hypothetical protein
MSRTYYHSNTTPGLTVAGALFNHQYETTTSAAALIGTGNIAANGNVSGYVWTPSNAPGLDGTSTGTFNLHVDVSVANADIFISVALARVNSAGTVQASVGLSSELQATAGDLLFTWTNPALGTWAAGDRLRAQIRFRNNNTHTARSATITVNTETAYLETPFYASTGEEYTRSVPETFSTSETLSININKSVPEAFSTSETLSIDINKFVSEGVGFAENISLQLNKFISESLSFGEDVTHDVPPPSYEPSGTKSRSFFSFTLG